MEKWREQVKELINEGYTLEELYSFLRGRIYGTNPTFYDTIVASPEWKDWEEEAYKQGFDYAESQECGYLSSTHLNAFFKFVKEKGISEHISLLRSYIITKQK